MNKLCKILLVSVCCFVSVEAFAGGDAANMSDHELRVKASWNCKSAQGWCAEDQSVVKNKCMCAKRMCDAAQRAGEASERGYDNGSECADGSSYCGTAKSSECAEAIGEVRGVGDEGSCEKSEGEVCVVQPGGQCSCHKAAEGEGGEESSTGNAKGLSCDEVKSRMAVHKRRCDAGNQQACKDYEDRAREAERCDKEREKERNTGNAKGDDCSTVIKKAQVHKANCDKGNKKACKDYEDRKKEAEKCEKNGGSGSSASNSSKSNGSRWVQTRDAAKTGAVAGAIAGGVAGGVVGATIGAVAGATKDKNVRRISNEFNRGVNKLTNGIRHEIHHIF